MDQLTARNWRDLIRPKNIPIDEETLTPTYGKFVVEPLERGFGITLGNSLRRVLLSSLQGAAITSVKIEGALHEFTSVPDVVEDVTEIILNLKEVIVRSHSPQTVTARIEKDGPCDVLASDIQTGDRVEILNPDHKICTVSGGGRVTAELTIDVGRGYVTADRNKEQGAPIGTIAIDSLFSPIKKVNYTVTNARVGQMTDYDKLTLEVWTNAATQPEDAVAFAAKILKEQLNVFINFEEQDEPQRVEREEEPLNENLFLTIDQLHLSVRAHNCLQNANIRYVGELVQKNEKEMLEKYKNFGRKSLKEIKQTLEDIGLKLNTKVPNWPELLERWQAKQTEY